MILLPGIGTQEHATIMHTFANLIDHGQIEFLTNKVMQRVKHGTRRNIRRLTDRYVDAVGNEVPAEEMYLLYLILTNHVDSSHLGILTDFQVWEDETSREELNTPSRLRDVATYLMETHPYGIISTQTFLQLRTLKSEGILSIADQYRNILTELLSWAPKKRS